MPNTGATTTAYLGESTVQWELTYEDRGRPSTASINGLVSAVDAGANPFISANVGPLPFGIYNLDIIADPNNEIIESNEANNAADPAPTITLLPQDPNMELTTPSRVVRRGEPVTIEWDTVAEYPMECTLRGPGLLPPGVTHPTTTYAFSVPSDSEMINTTPQLNAGVYTLACEVVYDFSADSTVTKNDYTFETSLRVEVVPGFEEI